MRKDDIRDLTRAIPFKPFRLTLTTGEEFVIRHPELIIPSLGAVRVAPEALGTMTENPKESMVISLIHIVKAELIPAPKSTSLNGQSPKN